MEGRLGWEAGGLWVLEGLADSLGSPEHAAPPQGFPDHVQQPIRGAQPSLGSSGGSWAHGASGVERGCSCCLSHGTRWRGEGVCHGCRVPEQGRRVGEGTCAWLVVKAWVWAVVAGAGGGTGRSTPSSPGGAVLAVPQGAEG